MTRYAFPIIFYNKSGMIWIAIITSLIYYAYRDDPVNLASLQTVEWLLQDKSPERVSELHKSFLRQAVINDLPQYQYQGATILLRRVTRHYESIYIPAYMHVILPDTGEVLAYWAAPTGHRHRSHALQFL